MKIYKLTRAFGQYGSSCLIAVSLVMAPLSFSIDNLSFNYAKAFAKGGNGTLGQASNMSGEGGKYGSKFRSNQISGAKDKQKNTRAWSFGLGKIAAAEEQVEKENIDKGPSLGNNHGTISNALEQSNAAHAPTASEGNAAPNSIVEKIAAYEKAELAAQDAATAAAIAEQDAVEAQAAADLAEQAYQDTLVDLRISDDEKQALSDAAEVAAQEAKLATEIAEKTAKALTDSAQAAADALAAAANKESLTK